MNGTKRHLVFLSLFSVLEILAVLIFSQLFIQIFLLSFVSAGIFFIIYFRKRMYLPAVLFAFIILFSCINPYRLYTKQEKKITELIDSYNQAEIECSAVIDDCRNYSSYSVIFARIYSIDGKNLENPFDARIGSYTGGALTEGDRIVFSGKVQKLSDIEQNGFDTATYLRSKRVFADFPQAVIVSSSAAEKRPFLSRLRDYSKNIIYKYVSDGFDFNPASISYAMFAGDKDYISADTKEYFTRSGITHVLCVSGMHLTIIMGVFYALFSFFTLHKRARCIAVILLCVLYTAFTGFTLSTIRAAIMCAITFGALSLGQKSDGYASLFFALLAIITFSPYAILDISLILSFSATLGILVFSETVPSGKNAGKGKRAFIWIWTLLSANLGAVFFTLPFACYFFRTMSVFAVAATLATSYLCELLLTSLLLLMLLSPVKYIAFLEPMLSAIGLFCQKTASLIIHIAKFFSSFKYAYTEIEKNQSAVFIIIFAAILIVLTVFIASGFRRARFFCITAIAILGIVFSFLSVYKAIANDGIYKVSYFRQNADDRQLCIKLEHHGHLIVNADSTLCMDKDKADFDIYNRNNYLLIIPDDKVNAVILADNIKGFGQRYGIKRVYVPETAEGAKLASGLNAEGIKCYFMPKESKFGNTEIIFTSSKYQMLSVDDGKTSTAVVFADSYSREYFDKEYDICAFFTRSADNQFKLFTDRKPDCDVFYTRMGRGHMYPEIENTFGKKSFYIKE